MNLTYARAAHHAKCSPSLVARMVAKGELTRGPMTRGPRRGRTATVSIADLSAFQAMVKTKYPKSGWRKRTTTKTQAPRKAAKSASGSLGALLAFAEVPADKRPILIKLAKRFSAVQLRLILDLD